MRRKLTEELAYKRYAVLVGKKLSKREADELVKVSKFLDDIEEPIYRPIINKLEKDLEELRGYKNE